MVLAPSRQVQLDPLGLYLESKEGWTPWVCDTPAVKTRVLAKERKNSKACMKEQGSKLGNWAEFCLARLDDVDALRVYGCLSISIAAS